MLGMKVAERTKNNQFLPARPPGYCTEDERIPFTAALAISIFCCRRHSALMLASGDMRLQKVTMPVDNGAPKSGHQRQAGMGRSSQRCRPTLFSRIKTCCAREIDAFGGHLP